jgi:hypothetical protein
VWGVRVDCGVLGEGRRYHVETGVEVASWIVFAYEWGWHFAERWGCLQDVVIAGIRSDPGLRGEEFK